MSKTKVLFVIDSLGIGGGEKSLVSLLSLLDYSKYDVDLLLFKRGGEFEQFLPQEVNIIPPPASYTEVLKTSITKLISKGKLHAAFERIRFSISLRTLKRHKTVRKKNQLLWSCLSRFVKGPEKQYDIAIGYSQGIPTFFVSEKVNATKKLGWINVYYNLSESQKKYQEKFYSALDNIVLVSENSYENFKGIYPQFTPKMVIIHDICNADLLKLMAEQGQSDMKNEGLKLLTVARLDYHFKGLDITANACRILAQRGVDFKWYFVGDGKDRNYLVNYIKENGLESHLILLGAKANPYPYFKDCDIYVQTSRQEGWGISLVEARLFNRPIVTTEFSTVWNQMIQGRNGIVTDFEPEHVADAIENMINDKVLYNKIQQFQSREKKGNTEEIEKLYKLISENS